MPERRRRIELDALRGLAVLLMLLHHFIYWLYAGDMRGTLGIFYRVSFGDLAAPLFYIVAGVALYLSLRGKRKRGTGELALAGQQLRRGLRLYLIGLILCLVAFGPHSNYYWGVLQGLAAATLVVYLQSLARRLPWAAWWGMNILAYYAFRQLAPALPPVPANVLAGDFAVPLLALFVSLGYGVAPLLLDRGRDKTNLALGGTLLVLGAAGHWAGIALRRFPASPTYLIFSLSLSLILLPLLAQLRASSRLASFLSLGGRQALFIFVVHYGWYLLLRGTPFYKGLGLAPSLLGALFFISATWLLGTVGEAATTTGLPQPLAGILPRR